MAAVRRDKELRQRLGGLDAALRELGQTATAAQQARTREIIQTLLEYHGAGLQRLMEYLAAAGTAGTEIRARLCADELLASLLLLHGLHPLPLETRVTQALEKVRPLLKSHRGNVQLLEIRAGVVYLRLEGSCHGCPSSAATLKNAIEEALYEMAPDLEGLEVQGVAPEPPPEAPSNFVPVGALLGRRGCPAPAAPAPAIVEAGV